MNIRLTSCRSFETGYSVGIFCDDGYRGSSKSFIKLGKLPPDSFIDAGNIDLTFDRLTENIEIDKSDYNQLVLLLEKVSVTPIDGDMEFMDGVSYFLHVDSYGGDITLAWNSIPPSSWKGIDELVQKIEVLINKYEGENA